MKRLSITKRFWSRVRREVAREARENMMSYAAAKQYFDLYEMRLDAVETQLIRKIVQLEHEIGLLRSEVAEPARPVRRVVGE